MGGKLAARAPRLSRVSDTAELRDVDLRQADPSDPWSSRSRSEHAYASCEICALTPRESEVLSWLAHGKSGPEIAIILGIRTCTVRIHIQSIKKKLNASNIPHAVTQGFRSGLL